jgi:hypothetical protein
VHDDDDDDRDHVSLLFIFLPVAYEFLDLHIFQPLAMLNSK